MKSVGRDCARYNDVLIFHCSLCDSPAGCPFPQEAPGGTLQRRHKKTFASGETVEKSEQRISPFLQMLLIRKCGMYTKRLSRSAND